MPPLALPTRPLGRTGHHPFVFSLGGQASLEQADKHDVSIAIINRALDPGVNCIDTAAAYGRPRDRLFKEGAVNSMKDAMDSVLTLPVSTVIIGCRTVERLEENVAIAKAFTPLPAAELARLEGLAANNLPNGDWFKKPRASAGAAEDGQNMD